jgi:F-type H+-transporting ATPase subunit b
MKRVSMALAAGAVLALAGGVALGQQPLPQPPSPGQTQRLPSAHPSMPGMGVPGLPDGRRPPITLGPDGRPVMPGRPGRPGSPGFVPGVHPGGRPPGAQPGSPQPQRPRPRAEPAEEEHGGGEHECPGHGPDDAPPPMNLWHGLLMVNNERTQQGDFVDQLLFRYENPHDPCDPKNEPAPYMASLINFSVLAFVLFRFGKKPIAESLAKRRHDIMAEIETAQRLKAEAAARLDEYEDKLEHIEAKRAELLEDFAAQAEVEKKHVLAEAEERRSRMLRDAEFRIEQELKAMRDELLREAVIEATTAAESVIQRQMNAADQDRMAAEFLRAVGPALQVGVTAGGRS